MNDPGVTHVLLADDHHVVRHGLRMLIDAQPDLTVVAEAGDGLEAVQLSTAVAFELAILELSALGLLDAHVGSMHGTVGCEFIVRLRPGIRVPETPEAVDAARLALLERSVHEVADVWATVSR